MRSLDRTACRGLGLVALVLALATPAGAGWRSMMAPGPVSRTHASLEEDCDQCHLSFAGIPDEKCLDCHADLDARIRGGTGFHATVAGQACIDCHTDHHGRGESQTREAARAGFSHSATGFGLHGAHAEVDCAECHRGPIGTMEARCASCHEDSHDGAHGSTCAPCHAPRGWTEDLKPLAAHRVPIEGGHEGLACADCHGGGEHLVVGPLGCDACHAQPHGGTTAPCDGCHRVHGWAPADFDHGDCTCVLPEKHQSVDCLGCHPGWTFTETPTLCSGCHEGDRTHEPLGECSLCHRATSWSADGGFNHQAQTRFPLEGRHLEVSCDGCHPSMDDFGAAPTDCGGCHAKRGAAAHGDFGDCAPCHTTTGFETSTFDHATTGFALTGRHEELACTACHGVASGDPATGSTSRAMPRGAIREILLASADRALPLHGLRASGVRDCVDCHADPHGAAVRDDCADCHETGVWSPSTFDVERHAETPFPLLGAHAGTDCRLCHVKGVLRPVPVDCASCHLDRHDGLLGGDCGDCHHETAFAPVDDFDHARTGFGLDGRHATLTCADCHDGDRGLAVREADDPAACGTCHVPTHSDDLGLDCATCHPPSEPFADARDELAFDHRTTGFPLELRHRALPCSSCHPRGAPRPRPRCSACHLDPHAGGMTKQCEDCHRPDRFRLARFDHDSTGWPLRGRHFVTPCASCHLNQRWVGVPIDCWGCHALDAGRARATARPGGFDHPFGPLDCLDCHTSLWRWTTVR